MTREPLSRAGARVVINGEERATRAATLAELLAELGYLDREVATALNGAFVPRTARSKARLALRKMSSWPQARARPTTSP